MASLQNALALLLCAVLRCSGVQFAPVDVHPWRAPGGLEYAADAVDRELAEEAEKETDRQQQMASHEDGLTFLPAPTGPGCFIRKVKGCPLHPEYSDTTWRRATHAEETMQAGVNRTACEVDVRAAAMKWCGAEEMQVLFVPPPPCHRGSASGTGVEPCQVQEQPGEERTPTAWGTGQVRDRAPAAWSKEGPPAVWSTEKARERPGEGVEQPEAPASGARSAEEVGENGAADDHSLVPHEEAADAHDEPTTSMASQPLGATEGAAMPDATSEAEPARPLHESSGGDGDAAALDEWNPEEEDVKYPEPQVADSGNRKPHQVEMTGEKPTEPGCFVRTPSGCPKHPSSASYDWKHDVFAERSTRARLDRAACEVERKARTAAWCGAEDVEMLFVPPFLPGCYVRTPSGCPNHPTFANVSWMREEYGGQFTQPLVNRSACEVTRRVQLGEWCGSEDVETLFVPVWAPRQEQDSPPGVEQEHHRGFVLDAPTEPGCYVRTPSGCPAHPSSSNYEWKHDGYAERSTKALTNRSICEEVRGASVRRWCGAEDVEMLYVPKPAPGCYMRTPSGCPRHPAFASKAWKHEEYGERNTLAKVSRTACEVTRKASVVKWCGSEDVQMAFIPPDWGNLLNVTAPPRRGREPEIRLPAEPGCFVRTPSGCPNHPLFNSTKWKHEVHGENRMKAAVQRQVCEGARKTQVRHWCGAEDVEMLFVPPIEPGCYMRLPAGCPKHSYFVAPTWMHEEHGEAYGTARWNRQVCENDRKARLAQFCGTQEVEMLFIPAVLP